MFQILFTYQRQWFIRKENDFRNLDLYQLREIKKKNQKPDCCFSYPLRLFLSLLRNTQVQILVLLWTSPCVPRNDVGACRWSRGLEKTAWSSTAVEQGMETDRGNCWASLRTPLLFYLPPCFEWFYWWNWHSEGYFVYKFLLNEWQSLIYFLK